jgi:hypothetical protein
VTTRLTRKNVKMPPTAGRLLVMSSSSSAAALRLLQYRQPAVRSTSTGKRFVGGKPPSFWRGYASRAVNNACGGVGGGGGDRATMTCAGAGGRGVHAFTTGGGGGLEAGVVEEEYGVATASASPPPPQIVEVLAHKGVKPDPPRLDAYLTANIPDVSRGRIVSSIKDGLVDVNGKRVKKPSYTVGAGDAIVCRIPAPPPVEAAPENIPLEVTYEDDHLMVVNKPAGMVGLCELNAAVDPWLESARFQPP